MARPPARLPAHLKKTYQILAPAGTHFRAATCVEVECPDYLNGWRVRVEGLPPEMLHAAKTSGRRWKQDDVAPGETWLDFEAGQPCFRDGFHKARIQRPELFVVRGGDLYSNPRDERRRHANADDWVDDFTEHQDKLVEAIKKG